MYGKTQTTTTYHTCQYPFKSENNVLHVNGSLVVSFFFFYLVFNEEPTQKINKENCMWKASGVNNTKERERERVGYVVMQMY